MDKRSRVMKPFDFDEILFKESLFLMYYKSNLMVETAYIG